MTICQYDGTFEGMLTVIFEIYRDRIIPERISTGETIQAGMFAEVRLVKTSETAAERVWRGLRRRANEDTVRMIHHAFLSEQKDREHHIYHFIRLILDHPPGAEHNYREKCVLEVRNMARRTGRETHRMHAFVRFKKAMDGLFYAVIEPDCDVIPLLAPHFKSRFADMNWLIFDLKRAYGLHYDTKTVQEVTLSHLAGTPANDIGSISQAPDEDYENLWKTYFEAVNIEERKNIKLHLRHVPLRYWKYLPEKNPGKVSG